MIEIEIKRTLSDFRADSKKPHIVHRTDLINRWPKWFYYLVTPQIADKVSAECPSWAGLLTVNDYHVISVKQAEPNNLSEKLSVKDSIRLFRVLGNQILSSESRYASIHNSWVQGREPYGIEYQI